MMLAMEKTPLQRLGQEMMIAMQKARQLNRMIQQEIKLMPVLDQYRTLITNGICPSDIRDLKFVERGIGEEETYLEIKKKQDEGKYPLTKEEILEICYYLIRFSGSNYDNASDFQRGQFCYIADKACFNKKDYEPLIDLLKNAEWCNHEFRFTDFMKKLEGLP